MYRLLHPTQHNSGMFAFIWQTIRAMYHYPEDEYYIWFGRESCYFDEEMYSQQGIDNVWDYYFKQPHTDSMPTTISSEVGLLHDEWSEFRDIYLTPDVYAQLLPHVQQKIDDFYKSKFENKRILGIHCRGTDHPDKQDMQYYVDKIATYIDDYDYVFIASDEQYRVDCIKQAFGDKVIEYDVTFRSISDSPLHYHNSMQCSKYYVGEDVIIEAYLLAKTNMLLCCTNSNVNYFARALNLELPYKLL